MISTRPQPGTTEAADMAVVLPTFQPGPFLVKTLASIETQTVAPREIVVVDDGSEPPVELPETELPIRLLRIPHGGIATARNAGVEATTAPLVHICDHDDVLAPTFYERQTATLTGPSRVDVSYAICGFIDGAGAVVPGRLPWTAPLSRRPEEMLRTLLRNNQLASIATVFRRDVFAALGGFRALDYVQDWDFWLRAAAQGCQFMAIPEILAWHRVHSAQKSSEVRRIPALEESLVMLRSLHLPPGHRLSSRSARAGIHLQCSRILRTEGRPGVVKHALRGFAGRPIEALCLMLGTVR